MKDFTIFAIILTVISITVLGIIDDGTEISYLNVAYREVDLPDEQSYEDPLEKEHLCVRQALFHEARGEGSRGIEAVASVIVNRVNSKQYPNTFCEVIHQPWQFSYTHELKDVRIPVNSLAKSDLQAFMIINDIARDVVEGRFKPVFDSNVKWYHTHTVDPSWNKSMKMVTVVGNHKFFSN